MKPRSRLAAGLAAAAVGVFGVGGLAVALTSEGMAGGVLPAGAVGAAAAVWMAWLAVVCASVCMVLPATGGDGSEVSARGCRSAARGARAAKVRAAQKPRGVVAGGGCAAARVRRGNAGGTEDRPVGRCATMAARAVVDALHSSGAGCLPRNRRWRGCAETAAPLATRSERGRSERRGGAGPAGRLHSLPESSVESSSDDSTPASSGRKVTSASSSLASSRSSGAMAL